MIEITTSELPWDVQDVQIFLAFLQTVTGKRLIGKWCEAAPTLLSGGNTNEICIRSGELRGFSDAVRSLLALQNVVPSQAPTDITNYPAPENDGAWNDGQTLNK